MCEKYSVKSTSTATGRPSIFQCPIRPRPPLRSRVSRQQRGILLEFEVALLAVDVGTDQDIVVAQFLFDGQRLRGDHGVDASHLVADLPADLEQVVGSQMEFVRV